MSSKVPVYIRPKSVLTVGKGWLKAISPRLDLTNPVSFSAADLMLSIQRPSSSARSYNPKPSGSGRQYWSTIGRNCVDFLAFCSQRDWRNSVEVICNLIVDAIDDSEAGRGANRSLRGLDYGSGFLLTTRSIISELNFQHEIRTIWDYFEPDATVRNALESTAQNVGRGSNESGIGSDILKQPIWPSETYDVVVIVHSGYYFDDFIADVQILRGMLKVGGSLVLVRLAPNGGFYLTESMIPNNGLYADFFAASREGIPYNSFALVLEGFALHAMSATMSRVRIPPEVVESPRFVEGMRSLLTRERYSPFIDSEYSIAFAAKFRERFGDGKVVDLVDEIAVYKRME